jgi:hypothetical protein
MIEHVAATFRARLTIPGSARGRPFGEPSGAAPEHSMDGSLAEAVMVGRHHPCIASSFAASVALLVARPAAAAPQDAAESLRHEAIYTDYLQTDFAKAAEKLERALALCATPADCAPAMRARLSCDLGVVQFALGQPVEGRARFAAAIDQDPSVALEQDLVTPELQRELAAAKAGRATTRDVAVTSRAVAASTQAETPDECPPQFPGCHAKAARSSACVSDDECEDGGSCEQGACTSTRREETPAPYARNWLSIAMQEDTLLLPSSSDACSGGTGYTCFGGDGSYYGASPLAGADDQVNGGLTLATSRVLVGYDRALGAHVTAGARLGLALGGGPQRPGGGGFLPLHVEARAAYWLGADPLARAGLRYYVVAAGGSAQVDASVPVDVYASRQAYAGGQSQTFKAWRKAGLGFVAAGPAAMIAFTPSTGLALEARVFEMFPTTATGFGLQMAYLVGF